MSTTPMQTRLEGLGVRLLESNVIRPGDALVITFDNDVSESEVEQIVTAVNETLPEGATALFLGADVSAVKIEACCHEHWPQQKTWSE
jgi:recombinational DNA repair protein RecR